jgi:hypothetical protein
MKKPIEVKAYVRESGFPLLILVLFSICAVAALPFAGHAFVAMLFGALLAIVCAHAFLTSRRPSLKARGAKVSDDGVSATFEGSAVWTLPWSNFGGYRAIHVSDWTRVLHPEKCGIEILNTDGIPVGLLNVEVEQRELKPAELYPGATRRLFWRVLDRHVPQGRPKAELQTRTYKTSGAKVFLQAATGITSFALAIFLMNFDHSLRAAAANDATVFLNPIYAVIGILAMPTGLAAMLLSGYGLAYLRFPKIYQRLKGTRDKKVESTPPIDGPSYEDYLIEEGGLPEITVLEDGVRYVQVDPEYRIAWYKRSAESVRAVYFFLGCYALLGVVAFFKDPHKNSAALLVTGAALALIALCARVTRTSTTRIERLRDTVIPHDDGLVIVKPDGTHLYFSARADRRAIPPESRTLKVEYEKWSEGKNSYLLDRTHLIVSSVQFDREDLKSLEQELPS